MAKKLQAPRGTSDTLPEQWVVRGRVEDLARRILTRAGYGRIDTPAFEDVELFARAVGESTDIVRKEMFRFADAGGRDLVLRPEGTAAIARAYIEHGMHKLAQPVKLWYDGPFFRQERPQAGRFRQFNQIGAEVLGSNDPLVDAELILLLDELLRGVGVPELRLRLGSLGSPESRTTYRKTLVAYLRAHEDELAPEVRERIETNPLRAFDSDDPGTREAMAAAPTMLDRLDGADAEHFEWVRALLDAAGVSYEIDPRLVRGLDYYTRTVFEFTCDRLGAQSGVAGGGRYDRLIAELGGPDVPACGWAVGIERIALAVGEAGAALAPDIFVAVPDGGNRPRAFTVVAELRRAGLAVEVDLAGRNLKRQLKHADRLRVRYALILESEGPTAQLKEMSSGAQREVRIDQVPEEIRGPGLGRVRR